MKTFILMIGLIVMAFFFGWAMWIAYKLGFKKAKKEQDTVEVIKELDLPAPDDSITALSESIGHFIQ